jgi:hypothetical protein
MNFLPFVNAKFQRIKGRKRVDKVFVSIYYVEPILAVEHVRDLLNSFEISLNFR